MRGKRITALLLCLLMLLSLTGCQSGDYKKAVSLTESGDWQSARELFVSLGDYKDAAEKLRECEYQIALEDMTAGDYSAALELLTALGDYADAAGQAVECRYQLALAALQAGKWDEAAEAFEALGDYKDAADMVLECSYRKAVELLAEKDYDRAAEIFAGLGEYQDAAEMYAECRYQKALQLYESGELDAAYLIFTELGDYRDADYYSVLSILQYDQQGFVDEFVQAISEMFKAGQIPLTLTESVVSYERDARYFIIDRTLTEREVGITFEPSYSDGSVTSRGQISTIHIMGDTRMAKDIETTLSETLISSVLAMAVLDETLAPEEFTVTLGEAYADMLMKFPASIPESGHFERVTIPYEHYQCEAAVSVWPNYYRFLFMITVPELVKQK